MTHAPPVPQGNQSPYPIAAPPHTPKPAMPSRAAEERPAAEPKVGSITRLAVGSIAALSAEGIGAFLFFRSKSRKAVAASETAPARKRSKPAARAGTAKAATSRKTKPTTSATPAARKSAKRAKSGDDPNVRGPRDALLIAMGEKHEVAYWTKRFDVDRDALQAAVDAVGNGARAVAEHLGKA